MNIGQMVKSLTCAADMIETSDAEGADVKRWCEACRAHFPQATDEECHGLFEVYALELENIGARRCCVWALAHMIEHTFFQGEETRH